MIRPWSSIRIWADMVKLSHSVFALPFSLVAAFLAARHMDDRTTPWPGQLLLIVICMVAARSVAMTFNRIVDARWDARNPRTAARPLPAGILSYRAAWAMFALSAGTFGVACIGFDIWFGNAWPILLAGPTLIYLCGYSFTKRITKWSHYYLGSAIAMAPVATWIAVDPQSVGREALILMVTVMFWIAGFDIIYACQDIDVDRRDGLFSLPARLGARSALGIARVSHGITVAGLACLGWVAGLGAIYGCGVAAVAVLLLIENLLVRPGDYRHVSLAFFTFNGVVSMALAATAIADMLLS
ncbi:MAG: UbiA-like polyprenyltransferase [Phycisphaerae bacterium]